MWRAARDRLYSSSTSLGLRRDLTVDFPIPAARLPIAVRPLTPHDDLSCLEVERPDLTDTQVYERLGQRRIMRSGLQTCYVAVGPDGKPCFLEWLIGAEENERVRAFFGNLYPRLAADEALMEGAFTPDQYRGQGIMASAVAQIALHAAQSGVRWVITFVQEGYVPALKGCTRAGFRPYTRRVETYRLFRRRVAFKPLGRTAS